MFVEINLFNTDVVQFIQYVITIDQYFNIFIWLNNQYVDIINIYIMAPIIYFENIGMQ